MFIPDCQQATLDELSILVTHFPNFIPQEDITERGTEFLEYQCTTEKELPSYLRLKTKHQLGLILFGIIQIYPE